MLAIFLNLYTNCNIHAVQYSPEILQKTGMVLCQEHVLPGSICGSYIISACPMGKAREREGHGTDSDGVDTGWPPPLPFTSTLI